jgi:hypothetical protein
MSILSAGGDMVADKKKTSNDKETFSTLDNGNKNDRHNDNARAAAALEQETPRINTDNL